MRRFYITVAAVAGLGLTVGGTPAMAGYCGNGPSGPVYQQNCHLPVVAMPSRPAVQDPVVVHTSHPMGHLRSIKYHSAPQVNITRLYGLPPNVGLKDVPVGFTSGCHPSSTQYCRRPAAVVAAAPMQRTTRTQIVSATIAPPPAPVIAQPLTMAPPPPAQTTWTQTSGPTVIGGMPATQVVCKRPQPPRVQVVRPVIGVPVPVPTPLPPIGCFGNGPAPVATASYDSPVHGLAGGPVSHRFSSVGD